jgi:hypothetical protein
MSICLPGDGKPSPYAHDAYMPARAGGTSPPPAGKRGLFLFGELPVDGSGRFPARRLSVAWITSGLQIRPERRVGTSAGCAFQSQVDCLAPGYDGFRAALQWEMKCSADEAQPGKVRRGP